MISLDDRKKIIKYLEKNKNKLQDAIQDLKLAIEELKTNDIQTVLTKKRFIEIFNISILFIKFIKAFSEKFVMEEWYVDR